ncbi:hypothetical protein LOK49_LG01G02409 [Camellia lanceoleosa]|uniref:Uncharacterized protein n=1 Tax=Camellia lanceoleosa TaxID=1840588 RepID=A0ACC0J2K5_9ERIC|nr:hypothetical protein LOK49_LG01G02409 [Camellia lanceoleosa]
MFQFSDPADRQKVLMEAPWSVMGYLMVLQPLATGKSVEEIDFKWSPFWIQVHGLPVAKLTRQNGEIIGRRIGNLVRVEALHDGLLLERSFLRLRVEVDVSELLPWGFILQHHGSEDKESWISYKYERLSDFCYDCGRLGHDKSSSKSVSCVEGQQSDYGPELCTGRAPRLDIPVTHIRHWVDVADERVRKLVSQRPAAMSMGDTCKMPHTNQNSIIDPAETACTADPEVNTGHAATKSPKHATLLSSDGVSANEVVVGSTRVSQVLDRDHL